VALSEIVLSGRLRFNKMRNFLVYFVCFEVKNRGEWI
jgi:hypothetical protein